jgi:SprT-like family protein
MKKLILALLLLLASAKALAPAVPDPLEVWYQGYNVALFNHELPDRIQIDQNFHDDRYMAATDYQEHAQIYVIRINPKYNPSPKQARENLLHEMCHMRQLVSGEVEFDDHGKKWQSCMHGIANKNGFEDLW